MIKRILKEKSDSSDSLFRMEFFCESEADVLALPTQADAKNEAKCATGSLAYVLTNSADRTKKQTFLSPRTEDPDSEYLFPRVNGERWGLDGALESTCGA